MDHLTDAPRLSARLRAGITVHRAEIGRRADAWIIRTPEGRHILANDQTVEFLSMLRTARTPDDLAAAVAVRFPGTDAPTMVERTLAQLAERGVLEGAETGAARPARADAYVGLADPTRVLEPLCGLLRRAPSWTMPLTLGVIFAAGVLSAVEQREQLQLVFSTLFLGDRLPAIAAVAWFLGIWHELAHATVTVFHGGQVRSIGMARQRWRVLFCVEIPDLILMPRRARMAIAAAGPVGDAVVASAALVAGWAVPAAEGPASLVAAAAIARVGWALLPALRTDGAYLLSEAVGTPGLERRARRALSVQVGRLTRRRPAVPGGPGDAFRQSAGHRVLALYGLLSVCLETVLFLAVGACIARGVLAIR